MLIHCREPQLYYTQPGTHWEQMWLHFYGSQSDAYAQAVYQSAGPVLERRRIEAAKGLLSGTNQLISEIAQRVGFDSSSHFIRTFRKHETISPNHYRRIFSY